jgi:hypothetical protein
MDMPWLLLARDLVIASILLSLWAGADAAYAVMGSRFVGAISVLDAFVAALAVGYIVHEWGHFAGARLSGGTAPANDWKNLQLFRFDFAKSEPQHFQWMTVGGNLTPWLLVGLIAASVPIDTPGRTFLFSVALGGAAFVNITELPVLWATRMGTQPEVALKSISLATLKRNGLIALGVALGIAGLL